jgi:hypothetical protein
MTSPSPETTLPELHRLTSQYIDVEDRLRLSGETAGGDTLVLWLTQRLMNRLLPHLFNVLQTQTAEATSSPAGGLQTEMVQGFAQQAARAQLPPQQPVTAAPETRTWLVESVDIKAHTASAEGGTVPATTAVQLLFKSREVQIAAVVMPPALLRQWLNILYDQWRLAGWSADLWPEWVRDSVPTPPAAGRVSLH